MPTNKLLLTLVLCLMSILAYTQIVTTPTQLNNAINTATPGTTIILADGTWNDVFIDIDKNGTSSAPITITAQNPGAVLMTGNSRVYMEGAHLTVSGLVFQDPANLVISGSNIEPVFELNECDFCKVINNKIDTYNGTEAQKELKFKWIFIDDSPYSEVAYNSFIGKYGIGSIINDNRQLGNPNYLQIHHNYFADRTPINGVNDDNDQDAIRIGASSTSLSNSNSEVHHNYFYNFFGEIEIISNKSGENKYYNNTFRDYAGCLTLRHGDNCEVYDNYFFAENNPFTAGVRVIGEGHKIYNNYIEGINSYKENGSFSNVTGGINVSNGVLNSALNEYYQVKNAQVINNTFVNCDYALRIGTAIGGNDQEPINLIVANNITYNSSEEDYQITTAPSGNSVSEGNIFALPDSAMIDDGNFHRLVNGSTPIDAGIGNYSFLMQDVLGANRDANFDAGAEEFGAGGTNLPYNEQDVGVNVGFGATSSSLTTSSSNINFGVCGGTTIFEIISNVEWEITENLSWLSLDISAGSGTTTITATTTENMTGAQRTGDISIHEIAGGDDLTSAVSAVQSITSFTFEVPIIGATAVGTEDKPEIIPENAYDNDNTTYWTGDPDVEPEVSITFDLGDLYFLTEIGINFWKANERTTTFSIAIADDAAGPFTTVIDTETSADSGATVNTEQFFSLDGTVGRYVKFIGIGNSSESNWTSIANVNIYGDFNCENAAVGIFNNPQIDLGITLFPVPTTDGLLNILSEGKTLNRIGIYNTTGQHILTTHANNTHSKQIDVSGLSPGVYFIQLEEIGGAKFIIR